MAYKKHKKMGMHKAGHNTGGVDAYHVVPARTAVDYHFEGSDGGIKKGVRPGSEGRSMSKRGMDAPVPGYSPTHVETAVDCKIGQ